MLALGPSTSDLIRVTTGSAADVEVSVSSITYSNATPPVVQVVDGEPQASITTATTTNILTGAASTYTVVKGLSLFNRSATSTTVLIEHLDASDTVGLAFCTLLQNESLVFTESGLWLHYDANGAVYPSVGNAATQAEMEAGTATDKYVTPLGFNWHPGAAKFWVVAGVTGNNLASWNVTSLTDTAAGVLGVTIATDFSTVDWACQVSLQRVNNTAAETNGKIATVRSTARATGTVEVDCWDMTTTTMVNEDPTQWYVTGYGDQ